MNNSPHELSLRYGMNPHQTAARAYSVSGSLPFQVLNGSPGYINLLDALNSWQLVQDLRASLNMPAAASFKHVSPAGAAVATPLNPRLREAYFVSDMELSPLATAYARARGADRVSSFGDFVALSDIVDESTAKLLRREVSDGVIAPGYSPEALALLQKKQGGKYLVLQMDPAYQPPELESRTVFGVTIEQQRNDLIPTDVIFENVTTPDDLPEATRRDMKLAMIVLKYTQSNSICLVQDGQAIGIGAGQQSRIRCTQIAASKADTWRLRQHPAVADLPFRADISRTDRDNAIEQYFRDDLSPAEEAHWQTAFTRIPVRLTAEDKDRWIHGLCYVILGSDGFIPFRDNIDRAARSGVTFVVQPGGSLRDDAVQAACDEYGIIMVSTGVRLFHH